VTPTRLRRRLSVQRAHDGVDLRLGVARFDIATRGQT
jgi:hypothetical protein